MGISRAIALLFIMSVAVGCSTSDPNQSMVMSYLKKHHGNDPVTIVKTYKSSKPDDQLLMDVKQVQDNLRKDIQQTEESLTVLQDRTQVELVEYRIDELKDNLKKLVASGEEIEKITGVRLQYRVPNKRGENELRDDLFIIIDGEVDSFRDLLSRDDSPLIRFGRRAFPD